MTFLQRAADTRVIAILRAPDAGRFVAASEVLYAAGCRGIEITLTSAGAVEALAAVRAALPGDAWVGAGTVMTPQDVRDTAGAGAQFVVSPILDRECLAEAARLGVPMVPGALTPSEIVQGFRAGAPAVKVSPVGSVGGVSYLRQVGSFLPDVPMLPTGGIELADVPAYLAAGAVAVGLGGPLVQDSLTADGDLGALERRTREVVASIADGTRA